MESTKVTCNGKKLGFCSLPLEARVLYKHRPEAVPALESMHGAIHPSAIHTLARLEAAGAGRTRQEARVDMLPRSRERGTSRRPGTLVFVTRRVMSLTDRFYGGGRAPSRAHRASGRCTSASPGVINNKQPEPASPALVFPNPPGTDREPSSAEPLRSPLKTAGEGGKRRGREGWRRETGRGCAKGRSLC